ncbi:MAG: hypothetical protein D3904_07075 [Candidatus Electrothrix sp. EH2]|nr:hypothetical protein [Candidatus Electrothrix sp. EH2]
MQYTETHIKKWKFLYLQVTNIHIYLKKSIKNTPPVSQLGIRPCGEAGCREGGGQKETGLSVAHVPGTLIIKRKQVAWPY